MNTNSTNFLHNSNKSLVNFFMKCISLVKNLHFFSFRCGRTPPVSAALIAGPPHLQPAGLLAFHSTGSVTLDTFRFTSGGAAITSWSLILLSLIFHWTIKHRMKDFQKDAFRIRSTVAPYKVELNTQPSSRRTERQLISVISDGLAYVVSGAVRRAVIYNRGLKRLKTAEPWGLN